MTSPLWPAGTAGAERRQNRPCDSAGGKYWPAVYFSRSVIPAGAGKHYHHVGMYTYRREALARYVSLARGFLEQRESLEQLRAIEFGMRIDAAVIRTEPLGVDTLADLERAKTILAVYPLLTASVRPVS